MTTPPAQHNPSDLRARLEILGDARPGTDWRTDERNYVAELGVTAADIPELVSIAVEWAEYVAGDELAGDDEDSDDDDELGEESADLEDAGGDSDGESEDDDEDDEDDDEGPLDPAVFAPIHAWRTLAQLRAAEAVRPLLETVNLLDACDDDWYLEEYPHVFAKIGPPSISELAAFLGEQFNAEFGRLSAARALALVATRHPESRTRVVALLLAALAEDESPNFVAYIISNLLDLRATEGALLIERAFAADRVDLGVVGNWNHVRKELGVPGTGLVPAKLANARLRRVLSDLGPPVSAADRREWNEAKRDAGFGEPNEAPKRFKTRKKKSR